MSIRIKMKSRINKNVSWGDVRIVDFEEDSHITGLLVLTEEESMHSIAPSKVTLEYKDGQQHEYELAGRCPTCNR